jgi:hypothetical protein
MAQPLNGPGIGLPLPANLYPSELANAPYDFGNATLDLAPGDAITLPAGNWFYNTGAYSLLQYIDPETNSWRGNAGPRGGIQFVKSDGFNVRIFNPTGCVVSAVPTAGGSGYVQSSTTITPSAGNSTWQPIVGGQLSVTTIAVAGSGYTEPPLVLIPDPPAPGIPASARAVLTGGSVTGVTLTNLGAGYITPPVPTIVPNPYDTSTAIVQASVTLALTGAGGVTGAICTNSGSSVSTLPTLTVAGAGTGASVTAVRLTAMTGISVVVGGAGYTGGAYLTTVGGQPGVVSTGGNPSLEMTGYIPRPAQALLSGAGGTVSSVSAIYDAGLFAGTPSVITLPLSGQTATTVASVTLTLGGAPDSILLQPGP